MTTTAAEAIAADYTLSPKELIPALELLVKIKRPVMVWGPPGIGKSDIARQVAHNHNLEHRDIRAPILEPVDLRGLPRLLVNPQDPDDAVTKWATPDFLPRTDSAKEYLLVFDELPAAPPMVQNAMYQLILDRRIGEYQLPPGAAMIACGNRETDRGATFSMPTPLASRFVHLHLKPDFDDWQTWALNRQVEKDLIFFLRFNPEHFHNFNPKQKKESTFPCPRTWAFVDEIMKEKNGLPSRVEQVIYAGAVGEGAGVAFSAFLQLARDLPDPADAIRDPLGTPIPKTPDQQVAMAAGLTRIADEFNFDSVVTYAQRFESAEVAQYLVDSCARKDPHIAHTMAYIRWETDRHAGTFF